MPKFIFTSNNMSFQPLPDELVIDPFVITSLTGPDSHTGLYFDADQTNSSILIKTNDTNAAYIDKFQNFGINTTAPGAQLDVNSASGSCIQITYNKSANKANLGVSSDGKLSLATSGGEVSIDAASDFNVKAHNGSTTGLKLNNTLVRASADQINYNVVTPGTATASKSIVVDSNKDITGLRNFTADNLTGTIQTAAQPNISSVNALDITTHNGSTVGLALGGTIVSASAAQLNYTNVSPGTASASKAIILDSNLDISGINSLSAADLTGTLQTAAQPSITSVGTLTDLDISGSITGLTDLSINTTSSGRTLIINSDVGNCVQLCYDTASGVATNYVDMLVSSTGSLSITPSGGDVDITTHNGTNGLKLGGIVVTASADQINYLQGTTPGTAADGKALIVNSSRNISNINNLTASTLTGTLQTAAQPSINSVNVLDIANHNGTIGLALAGTIITATASELNYTDVTQGTAAASKALVLDSSLDIAGINSLSATSLTGTLQTAYQPSITSVDVLDITLHDGSTEGLSLGGVLLTATAAQLNALAAGGASSSFTDLTVDDTITITNANGVDNGLILGSTLVLASGDQLNYTVVTPGTAEASKALVLDATLDISGINSLSATDLTTNTATIGGTILDGTKAALIDGVTAGTATANKALVVDSSTNISGINALGTNTLAIPASTYTYLTGGLQTELAGNANANTFYPISLTGWQWSHSPSLGISIGMTSVGSGNIGGVSIVSDIHGLSSLQAAPVTSRYMRGHCWNPTLQKFFLLSSSGSTNGTMQVHSSTNGINWTQVTTTGSISSDTSVCGTSLAYHGLSGTMVIFQGTKFYYSFNGAAWTTVNVTQSLGTNGDINPNSVKMIGNYVLGYKGLQAGTVWSVMGFNGSAWVESTTIAWGSYNLWEYASAEDRLYCFAGRVVAPANNWNYKTIDAISTLNPTTWAANLSSNKTLASTNGMYFGNLMYDVNYGIMVSGLVSGDSALFTMLSAIQIKNNAITYQFKIGGASDTSNTFGNYYFNAFHMFGDSLIILPNSANPQSRTTNVFSIYSTPTGTSNAITFGATTLTEAKIALIDNITPGTVTASKAVVVDANKDISSFRNLTASNAFTSATGSFIDTTDSTTVGTGAITTAGGVGIAKNATIGGVATVTNSTVSTTATTGALIVTGGVGISGALNVAGVVKTLNATDSSSTSTGSVIMSGGVGIAKNLYVGTGIYGAIQTATQTNITSVGTLTSIATSGSLTMGTTVISEAEIGVIDGVTPGTAAASKALVLDATLDIVGINSLSATDLTGELQTAAQPNITSVGTLTSITTSGDIDCGGNLIVGGTIISESEIVHLDGVTPGTAEALKAMITDANNDIGGVNVFGAAEITGELQTAAQPNITSVGTLTSITTSGALTMGTTVISEAEIGVIDGVTPGTAAASKALVLDANNDISGVNAFGAAEITGEIQTAAQPNITSVGTLTSITTSGSLTMGTTVISEAEIGVLDGVTPGTAAASKALVLDAGSDITGIDSLTATSLTGTIQTAAQPNISSVDVLDITEHDGATQGLSLGGILLTATATQLNDIVSGGSSSGFADITVDDTITITNANGVDKGLILGSTLVLASAAQLNYNVVTPGTASASKALVLDAGSDITGIDSLTATSLTGAIQTAAQTNITSVGTLTSIATSGTLTMGTTVISEAEIGVLDGITPGTAAASKALVLDSSLDISGINSLSATDLTGELQTAAQPNITSVGTLTSIATSGSLTMGTTIISEAEIGVLDGVTPGTAAVSKALVLDSSLDISGINSLIASELTGELQTAAQPNITSVGTLTSITTSGALTMGTTVISEAEIGVIDGVTAGTVTALKAVVVDENKDISSFRNLTATNLTGAIQTASQSLITTVGTLTNIATSGTLTMGTTVISEAEIGVLDGVTPGTAAASKALVLDASSDISGINSLSATDLTGELQTAAQPNITSVGTLTSIATSGSLTMGTTVISEAEIGVLDGVTPGTATASKALVLSAGSDITGIDSLTATSITGTLQTAYQPNITSVDVLDITLHDGATEGLSLGGVLLTATAAELNALAAGGASPSFVDVTVDDTITITNANGVDKGLILGSTLVLASAAQLNYNVVTPGTASASKALVLDSSSDITGIDSLTATSLTGTLQTAAQPNITSVGTLTSIATSGSLTMGTTIISEAEIGVLDGATPGTAAASKALVLDAGSDITGIDSLTATSLTGTLQTAAQPNITSVGTLTSIATSGSLTMGTTVISAAEIGVLDGVTPGTAAASKALVLDSSLDISGINSLSASEITGTLQTASQPNITSVDVLNIDSHDGFTQGLSLNSILVTATATELNYVDVAQGTATASKALVLDASKDISGINSLSATSLTGTLQTAAQPNITSVGTLTSITTSGDIDCGGNLIVGDTIISESEIVHLDGATPGTAEALKAMITDADNNISGVNEFGAVEITGTLQTAAQANITSVGTLTSIATSGSLTMGTTVISEAEIGVLDGVTPGTATASKALVLDAGSDINGIDSLTATSLTGTLQTAAQPNITSVGTLTSIATSGSLTMGTTIISEAEVGVLDGVTPGTAAALKALVLDAGSDITGIDSLTATSITGTLQTAAQPNITSVDVLDITLHDGATEGLSLGGVLLTATATELNDIVSGGFSPSFIDLTVDDTITITNANGVDKGLILGATLVLASAAQLNYNVVTPGTASASKALVLDSSSDITGIDSLTATSLTGALQTAAQPNITSVGTLTSITTSGSLTMGTTVISEAEIGVLDGVTPGTAAASKALVLDAGSDITGIDSLTATSLTGTLQTAAQPNITSVGTLTSIATSGSLTMGTTVISEAEIGVLDGVTPGTAAASKALILDAGSDITGIDSLTATSLTATSLTGTLQTAAQPNITSIGTLTSITTSGSLTMGTTVISEAEIGVLDGVTPGTAAASKALVLDSSSDITGINSLSASEITGTIQTAAQANITSVGTLTSITTSGSLTMGTTVISEAEIGVLDGVTPGTAAASKALVLDAGSDISGIDSLTATSLTGTLQTAAQANITSVGTLTSITTSGTLTMGSTVISAAEIGVLDAVTPGTATASKALVLDSSSDISGINSLSTAVLAIGSPANSDLPVEIGFTSYQYTGEYAYNNDANAHGIVSAGDGPVANYSLRADGRIMAVGEIQLTSDRRLKTNITNINIDMAKLFVMKSQPVRFNWKSGDNIPELGWIAQDVLKLGNGLEELVTVVPQPGLEEIIDNDGFINPANAKFTLATGKVIPLLTMTTKDLYEQNNLKDKKIANLEERLARLEALLL